jgi:hypothetical protein
MDRRSASNGNGSAARKGAAPAKQGARSRRMTKAQAAAARTFLENHGGAVALSKQRIEEILSEIDG